MDKTEFEKFQRAGQMIKAGEYDNARALLKTMPNSEKAREWLAKINEKEAFEQTPTATKKTSNTAPKPTPKPALTQPIGDMPITPTTPKKRFNWRKWALVSVVVFAILFFIGYLMYDNSMYNMGLNNLDEAKVILADNCILFHSDQYSEAECQTYASIYMDANVRQAMSFVACDATGRWQICNVPDPKDILGY